MYSVFALEGDNETGGRQTEENMKKSKKTNRVSMGVKEK